MTTARTPSRQQRRAAARADASPAAYTSQPSPYGPRAARRAHHRQPPPQQQPQQAPRLAGALSRPRRTPETAPHRDSTWGQAILVGLGQIDERGQHQRHVYGGTVPWPAVRDRRRRAQLARAARRVTRARR